MVLPRTFRYRGKLAPGYLFQPILLAAEVKRLLLGVDAVKSTETVSARVRFAAEIWHLLLALYETEPAVAEPTPTIKPETEPAATKLLHRENVTIVGDLDLTYATISRPIEFRNCRFLGKVMFSHCEFGKALDFSESRFEDAVDLHYCEFEDVVDFSGCEFRATFNSGDITQSLTLYKKDLIANQAKFHSTAGFNGARVEGSIYLNDAHFLLACAKCPTDQLVAAVDFTGVRCENTLECANAVFHGDVSFNAATCGAGIFHGARFLHEKATIIFRGATFANSLIVGDTDSPTSTNGQSTVLRGGADFRNVVVTRGRAIFTAVRFENERCLVDFTSSCFDWLLDFTEARFSGPVKFCGIKCAGDALFRGVHFLESRQQRRSAMEIAAKRLSTGDQQPTSDHEADGEIDCDQLGASDDVSVDFRYATIEGGLRLEHVRCHGTVDLGQSTIKRKLHLQGADFSGDVRLYDADIGTIVVLSRGTDSPTGNPGIPARFKPNSLDLMNCRFAQFHGGKPKEEWNHACSFISYQKTNRFSRDPYLRLAEFYRAAGDQARADQMLLLSHQDQLYNAGLNPEKRATNWRGLRRAWERVLEKLTGWGLRPWRLVGCTVIVFAFSVLILHFEHNPLVQNPDYTTPQDVQLDTFKLIANQQLSENLLLV